LAHAAKLRFPKAGSTKGIIFKILPHAKPCGIFGCPETKSCKRIVTVAAFARLSKEADWLYNLPGGSVSIQGLVWAKRLFLMEKGQINSNSKSGKSKYVHQQSFMASFHLIWDLPYNACLA